MTTRTAQFIGYGFGETPTSVTVTFDGNPVYTGTVPTQNIVYDPAVPVTPEQQVAFTVEIPLEAGAWPMTITVDGGSAVFGPVASNYNSYGNIYADNIFYDIYPAGNDCRSNVTIDGVAQTYTPPGHPGDWWYYVEQDQVFAYTLNASAGGLPPT
jgi:hypothetical protein